MEREAVGWRGRQWEGEGRVCEVGRETLRDGVRQGGVQFRWNNPLDSEKCTTLGFKLYKFN